MILAAIQKLYQVKQPSPSPPVTPLSQPSATSNPHSNIEVVERHMSKVIQQYRNDRNVAFAHSISAGFQDPRHMTTGVAVVFREKFRRPHRSKCLKIHLALQEKLNGAYFYSLGTKDKYFKKPDILNYNAAFRHQSCQRILKIKD